MNDSTSRIRVLFEQALDLPAEQRSAFLLSHCDLAEREQVLRLLAADTNTPRSLPVRELDALIENIGDAAAESVEPPEGSRVGPFTLIEKLGEGGSSIVYRAEREQAGVQQVVALKLLRRGLYSAEEQRRFRRERLALTQLRHPGVARLIEGDVTPAGIPYIALELIDGQPITEYVREHRLDLCHRLALFVACCRAVEAAHRALIVHRDLKPSNVLVTRDGDVKLLDFGIAKLLAVDEMSDGTQHQALTPAYAAPEQFEHGPITTATDVYALGVLLCEIVTGVRRDRHDLHAPSSRIGAKTAEGVLPASAVQTRRQLRGDLDNIVLKATHAEPEQRYSSAGTFADEIERYLAGQPVAAHPPSVSYRARKFVARHRGAVAATAIFALALGAALALALYQGRVAREQAARAETVKGFLVRVFQHASPDENRGVSITPHQLIEKGEAQIDRELRAQPALAADVSALLGQLYIEIGDFDRARELLARALAEPAFDRLPDDVRARVLIANASIESEIGSYDAATEHANRALALVGGRADLAEATAQAHSIIATALAASTSPDAEKRVRAFLDQDRAALGEANQFVADEWLQLGRWLGDAGRYDESEALFDRAFVGIRATYGERSNRMAHALNEYSNMLDDKGDLAGSERALRQAYGIRIETLGETHHDTLTVGANLISLLEAEGRFAEALPQRIALFEKAMKAGALHAADIAATRTAIGKDYRETGAFDDAEAELRRALEVIDTMEAKGPFRMTALRHLGLTQLLAGRLEDAEASFRESLAEASKNASPSAPAAALLRADVGNILRLRHDVDGALAELEPAAAAFAESVPATNPWRPVVLSYLAEAELAAGRTAKAAATAASAVEFGRSAFASTNSQLAQPLHALARAELALGHAERAAALLDEALALRSSTFPNDIRVLEIKTAQAEAFAALGRTDQLAALRDTVRPALAGSQSHYAADLLERLDRATAL